MVHHVIFYSFLIFSQSHYKYQKQLDDTCYWIQCNLLEFHCRSKTIKEHTKEQAGG